MSQQPWFTHKPTTTRRPTMSTYSSPPLRPSDISQKLDHLHLTNPTLQDEIPVKVTGEDIPSPVTTFSEMGFCAKVLNDNIRRCGYVKPTAIQRYAIPVAMAGRDLMASAQTGSGKTAAFCFPIISGVLEKKQKSGTNNWNTVTRQYNNNRNSVAKPLALILAPTRELSCQIHDEAKKFSIQTGVKVVVAYGGAPVVPQLRNLERGVDILVATPGRLVDMIERGRVSLKNIKYLTLDEADRMLDMGFERQVRKIVEQMEMPPPGKRQTMLFSATFPDEIQRLASDFLSNYVFLAAGKVGSSTDLIVQKVELVSDMDKRDQLVKLLLAQRPVNNPRAKDALTLVFVETKRGADSLERWLCGKGFPSTAIHGDKVQMERERALKLFRSGHTPIMVATDVAARGLDIPNVAHVVNFDLPRNVDDYVHRIGRTGRAGKSGLATAFFSVKNASIAKALMELMQEANQEVPTFLKEYADSYVGNGSGRFSRYEGSSTYGAYDYRSGPTRDFGYEDYSSQPADPVPYGEPNADANTAAYGEPYPNNQQPTYIADYNAPVAYGATPLYNHEYNYGPVSPVGAGSGWD